MNFLIYAEKTLKRLLAKKFRKQLIMSLALPNSICFISSIGKNKIDKATERVRELRKQVDKGKIDLSAYEDMAEEF
jgi:hypothetical protein